MERQRILTGEPWDSDPCLNKSWASVPLGVQEDEDLNDYNVIDTEEYACYTAAESFATRNTEEVADLKVRSSPTESVPLHHPADQEIHEPFLDDRCFSENTQEATMEVLPSPSGSPRSQELSNATQRDLDTDEELADLGKCRTAGSTACRSNKNAAANVASAVTLTAPKKEGLTDRLLAVIASGDDLSAIIEATKLAHHAISEKNHLAVELFRTKQELARLERALNRADAERRVAIVAAQELKYTNDSLHVMISELQAHVLNQQDAEEQALRRAGRITKRIPTLPVTPTTNHWLGKGTGIWLAASAQFPVLHAAEQAWTDGHHQRALCALAPLLSARQTDRAVEKGAVVPLSELGLLANLLRAAIQLDVKQHDLALAAAEHMVHEARNNGMQAVERRSQWIRGHALLELERPCEARACFGFCAGPAMPEARVREMQDRADCAMKSLPVGHPGREISEEFVQFYYQWAA